MKEPHCPICGYTARDAATHLDHGRCKGKIPKSKAKLPQARSQPEETFAVTWRVLGGPAFEREWPFHPSRDWRVDFAWPTAKFAVEIEGGVTEGPKRGRHLRAGGFIADCEKYTELALAGFRLVRLVPKQVQPTLLERIIQEVRKCSTNKT